MRRYVILGDLETSLGELRRTGAAVHAVVATRTEARPESRGPDPDEGLSLRRVSARAAEEAERRLLGRVLAETRWNRREAAGQLKISYKALLNKLKKWDLGREETAGPTPYADLAQGLAAGAGSR